MNCSSSEGNLYIDNDVPLIVSDLYNPEVSDDIIDDAVVVVDILDGNNNAFDNQIVLNWNADKQHYFNVVDASVPFVEGETYTFIYTITGTGGVDGSFREKLVAEYREA